MSRWQGQGKARQGKQEGYRLRYRGGIRGKATGSGARQGYTTGQGQGYRLRGKATGYRARQGYRARLQGRASGGIDQGRGSGGNGKGSIRARQGIDQGGIDQAKGAGQGKAG